MLNSVLVSKSVAFALRDLFNANKTYINTYLQQQGYIRSDGSGKPVQLAEVYIGLNPDQKKIQVYPSISLFVTGRRPEWYHYRATNDLIDVRMFCCIQNTSYQQCETLMYDFTEICMSVLFSAPTLPFNLYQDNTQGVPAVFEQRFNNSLPSITFGSLAGDYIRAGQLDWSGEVLLNHPDMTF